MTTPLSEPRRIAPTRKSSGSGVPVLYGASSVSQVGRSPNGRGGTASDASPTSSASIPALRVIRGTLTLRSLRGQAARGVVTGGPGRGAGLRASESSLRNRHVARRADRVGFDTTSALGLRHPSENDKTHIPYPEWRRDRPCEATATGFGLHRNAGAKSDTRQRASRKIRNRKPGQPPLPSRWEWGFLLPCACENSRRVQVGCEPS